MARAAVIPPSPVKRAPRVSKTTTKTTANAKKGAPRRPTTATRDIVDQDSSDTDDELGLITTTTTAKQGKEVKPAKPRGRPPGRPATKTAGRPNKVVASMPVREQSSDDDDGEEDELAPVQELPKKRGRPRKAPLPVESAAKAQTAPRPRGRPPKNTASTATTTTGATRKKTRAAAEADASADDTKPKHIFVATHSTNVRSNLLRGPAKKKTVTFQDVSASEESDDENPSAPTAGRKRGVTAGRAAKTGLAGTPARKPAARGRQPATVKKGATASKPLTPKKAKQMSNLMTDYTSTDGEEDELNAVKDPIKKDIKLVIHSPVKHASDNTGLMSPVRRVNFTPKKASSFIDENGEPKQPTPKHGSESTTGLSSPVRKINFTPNRIHNPIPENGHLALPPGKSIDFSDSIMMSSPARRPPASPFQYSFKDTPNRGRAFSRDEMGPPPTFDFIPARSSPLKMSPRKGHLGASFSQSPFKASTTAPSLPAKTSLFQSPAKRVPSPFKGSMTCSVSPAKTAAKSLPPLEDDVFIDKSGTSETQQPFLPPQYIHSDAPTFDEDYQMVEEVARDIFGIELRSDSKSSSSPVQKDVVTVEDALDDGSLGHDENDTENAEDLEDPIPQTEHELGHHVRYEIDEAETLCFDNMEQEQGLSMIAEEVDLPETSPVRISKSPAPASREPTSEADAQSIASVRSPYQQTLDFITDAEDSPNVIHHSRQSLELSNDQDVGELDNDYCINNSVRYPDEEHEASSEMDAQDGDEVTLVGSDATCTMVSQPVSPYEISEGSNFTSPFQRSIPPSAPTPPVGEATPMSFRQLDTPDTNRSESNNTILNFGSNAYRDVEDSPLNETTQSEFPTPAARISSTRPSIIGQRKSLGVDLGFTPLAQQFNSWESDTPSKAGPARPRRRGVFSLVGPLEKAITTEATPRKSDDVPLSTLANTPSLLSQLPLQPFSDDSSMSPEKPREQVSPMKEHDMIESPSLQNDIFEDLENPAIETPKSVQIPFRGVMPVSENDDDQEDDAQSDNDKENTPAPVLPLATPMKAAPRHMQTFHTVCKVPLKGEGPESPLKLPRKRGRSLEGASPIRSSPRSRNAIFLPHNESASTLSPPHKSARVERSASPPKRRISTPRRPSMQRPSMGPPRTSSVTGSPGKTPRRSSVRPFSMEPPPVPSSVPSSPEKTPRPNFGASKPVLRGAVVHVDVHTTEGEDASGIFVELLQQMGARCVKTWTWNPRSSMSPVDGVEPSAKVGITHVVYKDGGLRTMEKVKHAAGLVKCVGVGWVLDCERESQWLDETPYAVDSTIIPRGGAKRRKSMQPRALSNVNGTLVRVSEPATPSASGRRCGADWGAMEGFRNLTPPTPRQGSPSTPAQESSAGGDDDDHYHIPETPGYNFANLDAIGMSPATPFFLSNRAKIVQQSCPPKQSNKGLFAGSSKPSSNIFQIEEDDEEARRQKRFQMEAARRKSLAFKPQVGSPLGR
ncbi:hypothetical protein N7510_007332 [Penicillium lagena]|uniref:uncharacterized protein n=1 Tax=Penicillium lagena TaxID=94218 RepID=UPI002540BE1B|nr:uncharacterized protein N7510_007332 [Penicillium lagena]KAJ5610613.1 hypothetical protein N7510_007332 [Penicillium lagena]